MNVNDSLAYNNVIMEGYVESAPVYHHSTYDEKIYAMTLRIPRLNVEVSDHIPVNIPERVLKGESFKEGDVVKIEGQFRSFNQREENSDKVHLRLSVFAREISRLDETRGYNSVKMSGYICKPTNFRKTPLGREICDMMLGVQRAYKRSDYIPVIAWGRNAEFASELAVGTRISIMGRVQSRVYHKKMESGEFEDRTAYEVSISSISVEDSKRDSKDTVDAEEVKSDSEE